jgi:GMP synthase (glutamine-hydrolysing)
VDDVIFSPWKSGEDLFVMQNHIDCVERVPPGFVCLAKSKKCSVEVMRHVKRPIYGVQAHVERFSEEHAEGFEIIRNFVERVVLGV